MKKLVLIIFIALTLETAFAQKRVHAEVTQGVAVAFLDDGRLRGGTGDTTMQDFEFFSKRIQEIVKRDFPGVEFKILKRGELLRLPDGTGLNVENLHSELGYVLSARGRKRVVLSGVQSDADFACAAVAFFRRSSSACPK
jgi:hypothetical protein